MALPLLREPSPPGPAGALRWVTAPGVLLQRWPDSDMAVVYDPLLARTHLISGAGCAALQRCQRHGLDATDLGCEQDRTVLLDTLGSLVSAGLLRLEQSPTLTPT